MVWFILRPYTNGQHYGQLKSTVGEIKGLFFSSEIWIWSSKKFIILNSSSAVQIHILNQTMLNQMILNCTRTLLSCLHQLHVCVHILPIIRFNMCFYLTYLIVYSGSPRMSFFPMYLLLEFWAFVFLSWIYTYKHIPMNNKWQPINQ